MAHPFFRRLQRFGGRLGAAAIVAGLAVVGGLAGCMRDDPLFKVSDMAAAPELVGNWSGVDKDGKAFTLKITQETQGVEDGRLVARYSDKSIETKTRETVPVYTLHVEFPPSPSSPGKEGEALVSTTLDLRGYLLNNGSSTQKLLCIQSEEQPSKEIGSLFKVNTHWILGVKVDGDRLSIRLPSVMVLLAPSVKLLDAPIAAAPEAEAPVIEDAIRKNAEGKNSGGSFLTDNADRALGVVRRYGLRPGFWQDSAMEFTRMK